MVRTVHAEQVVDQERLDLLDQVGGAADERLGVVGQRRPVPVADGEVLGPHGRPVGRLPDEGVLGDGRGHAAPDDSMGEPRLAEDLRHLRDVAEHVGEIADVHDTPEGGAPDDAHLQVPEDRLTRGQELVHEDVPGPHADPPGRGQGPQPRFGLRPHFEVVVDHRHLAVQHEVGIAGVGLEEREQCVEHVHQIEPKLLVGLVPLAVPVRVRDDGDAARCHVRQTMACGGSLTVPRPRVPRPMVPCPAPSRRPIWWRGARCSGGGRPAGTPIRSDPPSWTAATPPPPACRRPGDRTALAASSLADRGVEPGQRVLWSCAAVVGLHRGAAGGAAPGRRRRSRQPVGDQERTGLPAARRQPSAALVDRPARRDWLEEIDPGCAVLLPAEVLVAGAREGARSPWIRPGPKTTR